MDNLDQEKVSAGCTILGLGLLGYGLYRWRNQGLDNPTKLVGLAALCTLGKAYLSKPPSLPEELDDKLRLFSEERNITTLTSSQRKNFRSQLIEAVVENNLDLNQTLPLDWQSDPARLLRALNWDTDEVLQAFVDDVLTKPDPEERIGSVWVLPDDKDLSEFEFTNNSRSRLKNYRDGLIAKVRKENRNFTPSEKYYLHITSEVLAKWLLKTEDWEVDKHKKCREARYSDIFIGGINANDHDDYTSNSRRLWSKLVADPQLNAISYILNLDLPLSEMTNLDKLHPVELTEVRKRFADYAVDNQGDFKSMDVELLKLIDPTTASETYNSLATHWGADLVNFANKGEVEKAQAHIEKFFSLEWQRINYSPPSNRDDALCRMMLRLLANEGSSKLVSDLGYISIVTKQNKQQYCQSVVRDITGVNFWHPGWTRELVPMVRRNGSKRNFTEAEMREITPKWLAETASHGFENYPTEPFLIGGIDITPHLPPRV